MEGGGNDWIVIFGWTVPLILFLSALTCELFHKEQLQYRNVFCVSPAQGSSSLPGRRSSCSTSPSSTQSQLRTAEPHPSYFLLSDCEVTQPPPQKKRWNRIKVRLYENINILILTQIFDQTLSEGSPSYTSLFNRSVMENQEGSHGLQLSFIISQKKKVPKEERSASCCFTL